MGEVADIIGGGTPSTSNSEFWDGDIDWYTPAEIGEQIYVDGSERKITQLGLDKSSATLLPANKTILFTSRAGIGKTAILRSDATTNQGFQSIVVDNNTEPYFIFSMTDKIKNKAISVASGSTFAEISSRALGQLEFMFPSINEQKAIGTFFSTLDQHITLHQRKLDKLKSVKQAYLSEMFPAEGERVPKRRFPGFTDAWELRKLGEVIEKLKGGVSIAPNDYIEDGYRTIPKGAVNDTGVADMSACKNVSVDFFEKNYFSKTSTGELITSLRDLVPSAPNLGRIVRIVGQFEEFIMPQGVYSLKITDNLLEDFLIAYSNNYIYRSVIQSEKNGSTQVHIRNGEFLNIKIQVPSLPEQEAIGNFFSTLDRQITLHQRKLEKLKNLKKALLNELFV